MKSWHNQIMCVHDRSNHHSSPFHKHEDYEFYLFLQGEAILFTESQGYKLSPGDLFIIPPQTWHRAQTYDYTIYERAYLNLPIDAILSFSTETTNLTDILPQPKNQPTILHLDSSSLLQFMRMINQIIRLKKSHDFGSDIQINLTLIEILLLLNGFANTERTTIYVDLPPMIVNLIAYIDQYLADDLSLTTISEKLHLSPSYVSRSFKKFMGITLQDYITSKRIEKACEQLKEGASVQEAAHASGYENYAHFIRSFKKNIGLSPGKFQKSHKFTNKSF